MDEMMTGPELDATVALRVMEWNWNGHPDGSGFWTDEFGIENELPLYSIEIAAAMTVFEKLRKSGVWCCLNISSDFAEYWTVEFTRFSERSHFPEIKVSSESLPLAICQAALKAVESV